MRALGLVGFASVLCILACTPAPLRAADKPEDLIVGKWVPAKENKQGAVLEFKKDGTVRIETQEADRAFDGTYRFTKDNEVELVMTFLGETWTESLTVQVTRDALTTKDKRGREETFKKAK